MLRVELRAENLESKKTSMREISIPRETREILQREVERAD